MSNHPSYPSNMQVLPEPDWRIRLQAPDGAVTYASHYGRSSWKRLTAVSRARAIARRNPAVLVTVELSL